MVTILSRTDTQRDSFITNSHKSWQFLTGKAAQRIVSSVARDSDRRADIVHRRGGAVGVTHSVSSSICISDNDQGHTMDGV